MSLSYYWELICQTHFLTKHYILIAEEVDEKHITLIQPMKEHRDAYDHITRVFGLEMDTALSGMTPLEKAEYKKKNMRQACSHEYRAFFDTVDWLTIILRERISKIIEGYKYDEICKAYPEYPELKSFLLGLPDRIANQRKKKDVGIKDTLISIKEYAELTDELYDKYKSIHNTFNKNTLKY